MRWIITRHIARSSLRWAAVWGLVFGLFAISSAKAYLIGYPTIGERLLVAPTLQSFSILLGQPYHAETVAGFTMWRVLVVIALIGGVWGLLTSTGLLRGDEEAGRWELLLAGQTTKRRGALQALIGLGIAVAAMFAVAAALDVAAGAIAGARFTVTGSLFFAVAMVSSAAMFTAIGAVTSQIGATRGQAAMLAGAALGASFLIRMIADSTRGLAWLRWLSPIGWVEEMRPLRDPQPQALLPVVALVVACVIATLVMAERRDLGASILRERPSSSSSRWLVGRPSGRDRLVPRHRLDGRGPGIRREIGCDAALELARIRECPRPSWTHEGVSGLPRRVVPHDRRPHRGARREPGLRHT